jgi:hypothetical protein
MPRYFSKWALGSRGPDANARSVSLEEQFIAGANPQRAPSLVRVFSAVRIEEELSGPSKSLKDLRHENDNNR